MRNKYGVSVVYSILETLRLNKFGGVKVEDKELDWAVGIILPLMFRDEEEFDRANQILKCRSMYVEDLVLAPNQVSEKHGVRTLAEYKRFMTAIDKHCFIIEKHGMDFSTIQWANMYKKFLRDKKLAVFGELGS